MAEFKKGEILKIVRDCDCGSCGIKKGDMAIALKTEEIDNVEWVRVILPALSISDIQWAAYNFESTGKFIDP